MQNVLKSKNMYLEGLCEILEFFLSKLYVLDHSKSIDMQMKKFIFFPCPKKMFSHVRN